MYPSPIHPIRTKYLVGCGLAVLLCSCAATAVKQTWKSPQYQGGPLKNIAVLAVDERGMLRQGFENRLAEQLRKQGVSALRSYEMLSLPQINEDKKAAAERLRAAGAQAIAILRLANMATQYREIQPGGERYAAYINGFGTDGWYNYYSMAFTDMSATYGSPKMQVVLESSLYDLTTAQRLWAAVTLTTVTENMDRVAEMDPLVEKIVAAMHKDRMVP
jgi:hypothetical protein